MKSILLTFVFSFTLLNCCAQFIAVDKPTYKKVTRDTINIRGIVYDVFGNPVPSLRFTSKNDEIVFDGYRIYTSTDKDGKFEIKGALFNDTLDYYWNTRMKFAVNGSRFFEIHLPLLIVEKNTVDTISISAKRTIRKKTPVFKVITNAAINDWYGVYGDYPFRTLPRKKEQFSNNVKSNVMYPEKAIAANIEGAVEIGFTIEKDGQITNFKILRGIGYGCDEAVINSLKKSPAWVPAISEGRPITATSSVIINFKLTEK
jgi:TonB family protein